MESQSGSNSRWRGRGSNFFHQRPPNYNLYNRDNTRRLSNLSLESDENSGSERSLLFYPGKNKDERFQSFPANRGRATFNRGRGCAQYLFTNSVNSELAPIPGGSAEPYNSHYQYPNFQPRNTYSGPRYQLQSSRTKLFQNTDFRRQTSLSKESRYESPRSASISTSSAILGSMSDHRSSSVKMRAKVLSNSEISLKPTTFVDHCGTLSSLEKLTDALHPKEASDKFVVNAIVGISACGKSSTWNEILKQPAFKTRQICSADYCDNSNNQPETPPGQDKSAQASSRVLSDSKLQKEDLTEQEFCPAFDSKAGNFEVLLCERALGRWFVFDTPPLLDPSDCSSQSKKTTSVQHNPSTYLSPKVSSNSSETSSTPSPSSSSSNTTTNATSKSSPSRQQLKKLLPKVQTRSAANSSSPNQIASKNSTLFSLQTLTFLFVCSDNVVIILDPSTSLDELFYLLLVAIMIVRFPTSTLYFYIPESFLVNYLNPQEVQRSIQKRIVKHFRSKANFGVVSSIDELSILLNQPKASRYSALIDYSSELSWLTSAHRYWKDIDIPGNLLYQFCFEHDMISFPDQELYEDIDFCIKSMMPAKIENRFNKSPVCKSKNASKSPKSRVIVEARVKPEDTEKTESQNEKKREEEESSTNSKTKRGGHGRGRGRFWKGSSRGRGNSK